MPRLGFESRPTSFRLDAARELEPLYQGRQDRLCGLYAIINCLALAMAPLRPLSSCSIAKLFRSGIDFLDAEGLLVDALCSGIDHPPWRRLGKHLHKEASQLTGVTVKSRRVFARGDRIIVDEAIAEIQRRLAMGQPLLIYVGGFDHYSAVCGYSHTSLILFDSCGCRWIRKSSCAIGAEVNKRHHLDLGCVLVTTVMI